MGLKGKEKMKRTALCTASKIGRAALVATTICAAATATSYAAALAGASSSIVTAASLAFSSGKGIRILNADTFNKETFGNTKTIAASTAQINALPILTLVAADGTTIVDTGKWHYRLSGDGKTLKFGPHRGLMVLVR